MGDLVEVDFAYCNIGVGVFVKYYGPHNAGWEKRAWILIHGEQLPVPVAQISLVQRA